MTNAEPVSHPQLVSSTSSDPLWYKDAVIYQLHVKSFFDANNDGIGDFPGLIAKLDYIESLGVNTIWLLPFYNSPRRDDGYDIAEYRSVHPEYGTLADVKRFIAEAHRRGMRVIVELVINHTSDQHPWFQRARLARPGSAARNFYVWSDTDEKYAGTRIIFVDTEKSNWTWDPVANAYYWHRFYSHQPDLNFDNPRVLEAILSVMRFWLKFGVDGLRLDAVPYLIEREGTNNENLPETHAVLKRIRAEIDREFPNVMLLAEANQWPEDTRPYFGDGDECHMAFNFPLMPRMYMALAQEDRFPITDILRQTPDIPDNCQWAIFLRNHDELTLEMVTDKERDYLWEQYAVDRRARLNLGIRRRLAPLMERDRRRVELLKSLLLSMPGTPVIYYGDEIFMGDNIYLGDRDGVRTPMQWSPDRNGGFSRADPSRLVLPPIMDPLYGYDSINVESQSRDPHSFLNWTRRLLEVRNLHQAFGRGSIRMLTPANRRILAYLREYTDASGETETILCVANVSRQAQPVEIDLSLFADHVPVEMIGGVAFPPIGQLPYLLTVQPYGFYWFLLTQDTRMPPWYTKPPEPLPDYITLVLHGQQPVLDSQRAQLLERDVLPVYVGMRRWFAAKDEAIRSTRFATILPLTDQPVQLLHTELLVDTEQGSQLYQLPLGVGFDEDITGPLAHQLAYARVRRGARVGFLTDAFVIKEYAQFLLRHLQQADTVVGDGMRLLFEPGIPFAGLGDIDIDNIRWIAEEQSNSSLSIDDKIIVKLFRRLTPGPHPEAEMARVLTERGYANIAALVGEVWRYAEGDDRCILAIAQRYVDNQGDAWSWLSDRLQRLLAEQSATILSPELNGADMPLDQTIVAEILGFSKNLGKRLGELHTVLAQACDAPAFAPEPASPEDCGQWSGRVLELFDKAGDLLEYSQGRRNDDDAMEIERLRNRWPELRMRIPALAANGEGALKIRIHGDLHLGQILVVQDDSYFIDFEGEPALPLTQRRATQHPLRDVAGILRSIDYATEVLLQRTDEPQPLSARSVTELRRLQEQFESDFLAAYRQAVDPRMNADSPQAAALLDLFILEKAVYELGYEAANRPDWFQVPLQGLTRIVSRMAGDSSDD